MFKVGIFHSLITVQGWQREQLAIEARQTAQEVDEFVNSFTKEGYELDRVIQNQSSQAHNTYLTITVWMRKKT